MTEVLIRDLMTRDLLTADAGTPLPEVARLMSQADRSALLVTENGQFVGIVTERDLVRCLSASPLDYLSLDAARVMSRGLVTVLPQATLFDALVLIQSRHIRHLPVMDEQGKVVGMVTNSDLLRAQRRLLEESQQVSQAGQSSALPLQPLEDSHLKIGNRRAFEVDIQYTHAATERYGHFYALIVLELDYFEAYADGYGGEQERNLLQRLTRYIQRATRQADRIYRLGDARLVLLLPETPVNGAQLLADRLVTGFAALTFPHQGSPLDIVTLSAGYSCFAPAMVGGGWQQVFDQAMLGLESAQKQGGNQVGENAHQTGAS